MDQGERHADGERRVTVPHPRQTSEADRIRRPASPFLHPGEWRPWTRRAVSPRLVVVLLAAALAGCGGGSATPSPSPSQRPSSAASGSPSSALPSGPPSPSASTATSIRVQLRGTIRTEFAGFIAAIEEGYFEAADLDVTLVEAPPGTNPVAAGSATDGPEFTVAWVPAVLQARGKATSDLVDIGQLFQRSGTLSLSWRDDEITGARDFRDKTIGTFGLGDGLEVLAGAIKAGLDPSKDFRSETQRADLDGPIDRDLDVAQTTIYDGYARLLESTNPRTHALYESSDLNVINWYDEGTAMLQDAVFARASWLELNGNEAVAQRFLKATFQGWIYCRDHAADCVTATIDAGTRPVASSGEPGGAVASPSIAASPAASGAVESAAPRPTFGPGHHAWSMNEVNALVWPAPGGIGVVDDALWGHTVDVLLAAGAIPARPAAEAARTDLADAALAELADIDTAGMSFAKSPIEITPGGE